LTSTADQRGIINLSAFGNYSIYWEIGVEKEKKIEQREEGDKSK